MKKLRVLSWLAGAAALATVLASSATGAPPTAPSVTGPSDGVVVDALPVFAWDPVAGADRYEWEIAADAGFNSPVLGANDDHFFTKNTRATMKRVIPNGRYWWHVRAVASDGSVSPWSATRSFTKSWARAPSLQSPANGSTITFPAETFRLSWSAVPGAARYVVKIATDPTLGSVVAGDRETQATSYTLSGPLAPDQTYYWGITPLDAAGNPGSPSDVWSFTWRWPSATTLQVTDVASPVEIYDHRFSWAPVPGAAGYELEVNSSSDFAPGSRVCCPVNPITGRTTIGTSYSPTLVLPNNNTYYWRVRALDASGNAGVWNQGPQFLKSFDNVLPSVQNLRMLDNPFPDEANFETTTPIVAWDPVPGASAYEVEVVPYSGGCQWTSQHEHWKSTTATPYWTPLGAGWNRVKPYQNPLAVSTDVPVLVAGHSYCVRVTALDRPSDTLSRYVRSAETYLPNEANPAFTWLGPPAGDACSAPCNPGAPGSGDYLVPTAGHTTQAMSLFRWKPLAGYESYFVLVAKDPEFTNVVDYAFTQIPAYAPRTGTSPRTYSDETTLYYWVVLPATDRNGGGVTTAPRFAAPSSFHKQSVPPALLEPADGTVFSGAPTFHWAPAVAARRYRLQVASDPTFSSEAMIEEVLTDSTSYTSSETYPADTNLYWRVRADAESVDQAAGVGLTWSRTGGFRKTLLAPVPDPGNPTSGDAVPTWQWAPVPGAVSYDFELVFPDGQSRVFQGIPSNAGTPVILKGTGIWKWRVRANFPQVRFTTLTRGPWSPLRSFTRTIREPANPSEDAARGRLLLRWEPKLGALNYRVQVSTREDFGTFVQRTTTENSSFAPLMTEGAYAQGGTFYWRVAAADDEVVNAGDFTAVRTFTLPSVGAPTTKAASRVTVMVRKTARAVTVRGAVSPAHRGRVSVTLQRRRGSRFVRVAAKGVALNAASRYATSFRRPRARLCRVVVRFAGDADHRPSTATRAFRC
ncbi:MAG TPA: hypothetical protein VHF67_01185 [Gaiellaceae bacterium]|nr:hypothetical protein [Gaiellaceae bacterium]